MVVIKHRINTRPRNKWLKWVSLSLICILLGIGIWIGYSALNAARNITGENKSIFSVLSDLKKNTLEGQSEGRTNILLLGMGGKNHPGGQLSDTMIIVSIDWSTKKVAMISVPRDLWVKIPNYWTAKINEAYYAGERNSKKGGSGGASSSQVVSEIFNLPIHYYLTVDFDGFKSMIDTVGGLDIYVEKDLYDPYYPAANMIDYDPLKIKAGLHHMDGVLALKYARSRETTSDFDRSRRQEQVMAALKEKVLTLGTLANPLKITELLNTLGAHMKTNLSVGELKALGDEIKDLDTKNIINKVLDTAPGSPLTATTDERGYIIYPKKGMFVYTDLQLIAKNIFMDTTVPADDLKIEVLNGGGKAGAATQVGQLLKSYGYNVIKVGDATRIYPQTIIYNCVGSKGEKLTSELVTTLKSESSTKTYCQNVDIQVIIGQDKL